MISCFIKFHLNHTSVKNLFSQQFLLQLELKIELLLAWLRSGPSLVFYLYFCQTRLNMNLFSNNNAHNLELSKNKTTRTWQSPCGHRGSGAMGPDMLFFLSLLGNPRLAINTSPKACTNKQTRVFQTKSTTTHWQTPYGTQDLEPSGPCFIGFWKPGCLSALVFPRPARACYVYTFMQALL